MRLNPAQRKFVMAALIAAAFISHVSVVRWRPFATNSHPSYAVVAITLRHGKWSESPEPLKYTPAAHAGIWVANGVKDADAMIWGVYVPIGLLGLLTFLWLGWRTPAAVQPTTAEPPAG